MTEVCGKCKPSVTHSSAGPQPWGSTQFARVVEDVGECERESPESPCVESTTVRCRVQVRIDVVLDTGYYLREFGVGPPIYLAFDTSIAVLGCGQMDGWWAHVYYDGESTPHATVTCGIACSDCEAD